MPSWTAAFCALFIKRRTYWEQSLIHHRLTLNTICKNSSASALLNGPNPVKTGALVTSRPGCRRGQEFLGETLQKHTGVVRSLTFCMASPSPQGAVSNPATAHIYSTSLSKLDWLLFPLGDPPSLLLSWGTFTEWNDPSQPLHAPRAAAKPWDLTPKGSVGADGSPPTPDVRNDANHQQSVEKRSRDFVPRQGGKPHRGRLLTS